MPINPAGLRAKTFVDVGADGSFEQRVGLVVSHGLSDAFKIPMTGDDGKIDRSLIPDQIEPGEAILAAEALGAGDFVTIMQDGQLEGIRYIYRACTEERVTGKKPDQRTFKPAPSVGFVVESWAQDELATVFVKGVNSRVPTGRFALWSVAVGEQAILDPSTPGSAMTSRTLRWSDLKESMFLQQLGTILDISATAVRINYTSGPVIRLNTVVSPLS